MTTTTITENQAICMYYGAELTDDNVKVCKEKFSSWGIIAYAKLVGEQTPMILTKNHLLRSTHFNRYLEEKPHVEEE